MDSGLLGIALEKLAKEFKRIMVQHTLPLTLPDRLDPAETKDLTEQIMLPPAVLKRLQAIMQNLATNGGLEKCVESYREIRSTRAFVSLQVFRHTSLVVVLLDSLIVKHHFEIDYCCVQAPYNNR